MWEFLAIKPCVYFILKKRKIIGTRRKVKEKKPGHRFLFLSS